MRAEELIMEIYKQKNQRMEQGLPAEKVIMNMKKYRMIQNYHRRLGPLDGSIPDYITTDSLFGLEILIDNRQETVVS